MLLKSKVREIINEDKIEGFFKKIYLFILFIYFF